MSDNTVNFACFLEKADNSFYLDIFHELKCKISFAYGVILYKKGNKYIPQFETSYNSSFKNYEPNLKKEAGLFKLKIPIIIKNVQTGYFLLIKKQPFTRQETETAQNSAVYLANKIKDFEFSKIFQNQLVILQNAILEKNTAQKKLIEQNEKLVETDKIRTEFLANVSHELRTPLNSIIGFATAIRDEMAGPVTLKQKSFANKILSSAIHLSGLINDILDMTKIEAKAMRLNLRKYSPSTLIGEVINTLEPLALEKNIKIETNINFKDEIQTDAAKFKQIMYNLIGNAIKFSHANSKIKIFLSENKNNSIVVKVQDFGVGIDKKDQKKIFEKFVQLDNIYTKTYSSTGLGLTITQELAKLLGGKICVKSALGKGAAFILEFKK